MSEDTRREGAGVPQGEQGKAAASGDKLMENKQTGAKHLIKQGAQPAGKKKNKAARIAGTLAGAVILCGIGAYLGMSYYYSNKFFPGTKINAFEVGDMTMAQCEAMIREKVEDYSIAVSARGFEPVEIQAKSLGYEYQSDGTAQRVLEEQNPLMWIQGYFIKHDYKAEEKVTFDKAKVQEELRKLECMKPENQIQPQDATITFKDRLFAIVPGAEGAAIDENKALEAIYKAIENTADQVDLDKEGAYLEPNVREDDEGLIERLKIVNTYAKATITHTFGDETETLDSTIFKDWYSKDDNGSLYLDGEVLKDHLWEYVGDMAYRHDTVGTTRDFVTTSGRTVQVGGGTYGWQIDQEEEVEKMYQEILNGEEVTREPVYESKGASRGEGSDIGNTYVEVDLSAQHMYFYQEGNVIFESDFVSGNMQYEDRKTPSGVCKLTYKTTDFTLRGEKQPDGSYEYEEPVKYWMPFNGGVGFHDAPWRSAFGGDYYISGGSHGCINMPNDKAAQLYELIDESTPIICFY